MSTLTFTVDAKLLAELGERLVGRPHIALAELIKNAYDADAHLVELTFEDDLIRIVDDGHGMSERSFIDRWMRVGTTAKVAERTSPSLGRPLTGSKGVGRLAAQLLANSLELRSVAVIEPSSPWDGSEGSLEPEIWASVDWMAAQRSGDLTDVEVDFIRRRKRTANGFAGGSAHGTEISLTNLTNSWTPKDFERLARELWALQPPFDTAEADARRFQVLLHTQHDSVAESFEAQMRAILDIASARVVGRMVESEAQVGEAARRIRLGDPKSAQTEDLEGDPHTHTVQPAATRHVLVVVDLVGTETEEYLIEIPDCQLEDVDFEIRVFDLVNRQPRGIKVEVARNYLNEYGGVHLYDAGFRLPYYGPETDWLRLELDHARRLSRSQLLPEPMQAKNAMQDLPTNKRVFGSVNISTGAEQREAYEDGRRPGDALAIQITRDRLVDNKAFDQLVRVVRTSIDMYAMVRARTKARGHLSRKRRRQSDSEANEASQTATRIVEALKEDLPPDDYEALHSSIDTLSRTAQELKRDAQVYNSLLGALATAGMTSLAYEHEISKQRREVQAVARRLEEIADASKPPLSITLLDEATRLRDWSKRAKRIRALFAPLLSEETRTAVDSYDALKVLSDVERTMQVLARGAKVDISGVPAELSLPRASYAAWIAVFQNLMTNAFRAGLSERPARVQVDGGATKGVGWVRVQNNGVAVDLADADRFFLPFERSDEHVERSEALGLGGSGLGLTIVRMIAEEIGCVAKFVEPESPWSTAIQIEWEERR